MKIDNKSAAYAYERPHMEIVRLTCEDVVRTSDVPAGSDTDHGSLHSASESLLTGEGVQSL